LRPQKCAQERSKKGKGKVTKEGASTHTPRRRGPKDHKEGGVLWRLGYRKRTGRGGRRVKKKFLNRAGRTFRQKGQLAAMGVKMNEGNWHLTGKAEGQMPEPQNGVERGCCGLTNEDPPASVFFKRNL